MGDVVRGHDVLQPSLSKEERIRVQEENLPMPLRRAVCAFIQATGQTLRVPQLTIATAMIFFHRFYARQSFRVHNPKIIGITALFLAGKVEETPKKLKDVLTYAHKVRVKYEPDDGLEHHSMGSVLGTVVRGEKARASPEALREMCPHDLILVFPESGPFRILLFGEVSQHAKSIADTCLNEAEQRVRREADDPLSVRWREGIEGTGVSIRLWDSNGHEAESLLKSENIIEGVVEFLYKPLVENSEEYWKLKEDVLLSERHLLHTFAFELVVHHPYKPLIHFVKTIQAGKGRQAKGLAQAAWNFVNDSLRTPLCLQYPPHVIASSAIFLGAKILKIPLPGQREGEKPWWVLFDVTIEQIEDAASQVLDLYDSSACVLPSLNGDGDGPMNGSASISERVDRVRVDVREGTDSACVRGEADAEPSSPQPPSTQLPTVAPSISSPHVSDPVFPSPPPLPPPGLLKLSSPVPCPPTPPTIENTFTPVRVARLSPQSRSSKGEGSTSKLSHRFSPY
eukprot:TRINITY_DN1450_c0_g1_i2.p1 TRINITY_DN1450_c0_g1~~TRINITY_DN1450_c0_g1_i2.p1  ORF type:complete len:511 (-),score=96.96 TRINITY_DN1450_c0_g1_i2:11-1543(-)